MVWGVGFRAPLAAELHLQELSRVGFGGLGFGIPVVACGKKSSQK